MYELHRALAVLSLLLCFGSSCCDDSFTSDTIINNVVQDPQTGRIYLGAINHIYQLNYDLQKESSAVTGPRQDNPQCTPPITAQCTDAKDMDNINKLLLVNSANGTLIVCGSLFRGICSLVNLNSVDKSVYYSDIKGEKTYVASTEESVTVVGVISYFIDASTNANLSVFLVGKGYGSSDSSKLISTRLLQEHGEMDIFENMVEASTVQASPFVQRYLHDFRLAFKDDRYIYFLFSRTPGTSDSRKITFIARLCEKDPHYYSYTELQLNCSVSTEQQKSTYNKVQAAYLAKPGEVLAGKIIPSNPNDKVLFAVFSADEDGGHSALCMYPLSSINARLEEVIESCYIGEILEDKKPKTDYKCGADFLPSPLASKPEYALAVNPILTRNDMLTAVAVAVENEHTVAFLGTSGADVLKVHLDPSHPYLYNKIPGERTDGGITKVPVQACEEKYDCQSCVSQRDPYCGWCVLEGRCTRKKDCRKAELENTWLWSPNQTCVTIQSFNPPNISCKKTERTQVLKHNTYTNTHTLCIACVTSKWGCQWNSQDHTCSDRDDSDGMCPQFEISKPLFIPVGFKTPIEFQGKNLDKYLVRCMHYFFWYIVFLLLVLYNCSVRREDCSLCKNTDQKYKCVWCDTTKSCIYKDLCSQELEDCPPPKITDIVPRYGPMKGKISVTIKGSNLGIKQEDIKRITVAKVPCTHQPERYSVSTRYSMTAILDEYLSSDHSHSGEVEVEVEGGKTGLSNVLFTYRDPVPTAVSPSKGPAAGGTVITITGKYLDTASIDDISITVDKVPCKVGENIWLCVFSGGRKIIVMGSGFDQVQRATMRVLPSSDEFSHKSSNVEVRVMFFVQEFINKSENVLEFLSPVVNKTYINQSLRTVIQLDNLVETLTEFVYHQDPSFDTLTDKAITENSIISVHASGKGLSKAMTAKEAQAFVGDVSCTVTFLEDDKLFLVAPSSPPKSTSRRQRRDTSSEIVFGKGEWKVGSVRFERKYEVPLYIIIPAVLIPMVLFIVVSIYCYRRKSQQAEREYEKIKNQLANLEESVRDRCKKEFTDLMIEMEDHTSDMNEARIPFLDYKNYTNRVFFLPSKDGANDVMITGKLDIPENRRAIVDQALNQFSNLLNSKTFLINFIRTLEGRQDFNARNKVYFASLLTVALHGKLEYYTDIMRTLLLELMEEYVHSKNPKLMLRRSETVVERMLCNWMSICLYQFLKDSAGEPLYKLFKAIKHQVEKGPVDAKMKKAKYTLNDTGLLGDDVEYTVLTLQVLVHGEGPDVTPVKVLNCDSISQVKEKIIEQVYRNLPYSQRPTVDSVALEWRPGSTGQILSDLDLTSQKEGRWKRINTLAHYNVRDGATLVLSRVLHTQQSFDQNQDNHEERNALLEDDKVFHLVRPADELDEVKSKRGSMKDKGTTKAITEIYLTRLLSMKGTLQQFVDDFFRSVLSSGTVVPPAVKYFFDFLDEQAQKHDNVDDETIHIWKTNSLPLRFWVNILKNPHFIFDVHVTEVVDASLSVIAQTFMDACTKTEHKLTRESPSNKLLYAKEISTYKKMVDDYYKGIRQMVPVSDQDMNTHLAEVSRSHTDTLNTQVALHQLYQYASKYYDGIISSLEDDPAAQSKQLTLRLQQIAAALENKVTDL
uniref:Sema domain-containing protein n=1 Tax=Cyprinus carpio carpio TaxID=630221 RepID=A0A9J7YYW9_CYPCA